MRFPILIIPLFIALAAKLFGNPIIVDYDIADAIKSSENLKIEVGADSSRIHGTFTYRRIPNLRKESHDDYSPSYFGLAIPVYRHVALEKRIIEIGLKIRVAGQYYDPKEEFTFDWKSGKNPSYRASRGLWEIPKNYEVAVFTVQLPIDILENQEEIYVEYVQEHVSIRGRPYLLYTPYFENPRVWEGIGKDLKNFQIWITGDSEKRFAIDPIKADYIYIGKKAQGHLVWPEHLRHIEIKIGGANKS